MIIINVLYYLLRRIFGRPNEYYIITDAIDDLKYSPVGEELLIAHKDTFPARKQKALWKLTKKQVIDGLRADALKFIDSKTEYYGNYDISYIQPCKIITSNSRTGLFKMPGHTV